MLIRAKAAQRLVERGELEGWAALALILMPSEDVERASMTVALETGPSRTAYELGRKNWGPRKKRRPQLPKRMRDAGRVHRSESVTLDELLVSL